MKNISDIIQKSETVMCEKETNTKEIKRKIFEKEMQKG
jgi:hypothetical protein